MTDSKSSDVPYCRLEHSPNISHTKQTLHHDCNGRFGDCSAASRMKLILNEYNNIINYQKKQSEFTLQYQSNQLINNIICNGQYSDVELLNDFYHIKYDHNTNDDPDQFTLFYKYALGNDISVLNCDSNNCHSDYRRNRSIVSSQYTTLHILSRIHVYFIHSHDIAQLNDDEIQYINQRLSESKQNDEDAFLLSDSETVSNCQYQSKFITSDCECINYADVSSILSTNGVLITTKELSNGFDHYGYHKQQLIEDLSNIMIEENEENALLSHILLNELNCDQHNRKLICSILCHKYIMMNNQDFISVLLILARKFASKVDPDEIVQIVTSSNLTAKLFIKGSLEFKNRIKFCKIFKHVKNFNKKQWSKIYEKIDQWTCSLPKQNMTKLKNNESLPTEEIENKYAPERECIDDNVDYIEQGTDSHIIQEFCSMTNSPKNTAISFLEESEWNPVFAAYKYHAANRKISTVSTSRKRTYTFDVEEAVYNHGIAFWYWKHQPPNKIYVKKKFHTLQEELIILKQWKCLIDECNILMQTNQIKTI
eukprot:141322_1